MRLASIRGGSSRLSPSIMPVIESMEPRQLMSVTAVVTNQGAAHDSFGDSTSGWTGILITLKADSGSTVSAIDMGQTSSSGNGIFGSMLQDWFPGKSGPTPSPLGLSSTDTNGGANGTDSHVLARSSILVSAPFEDSDKVHPTGAPANDASDSWGTGSYLRGVFGIGSSGQTNGLPLAYIVLKNGTTGHYAFDVSETSGTGQVTAHLTGTFSASGGGSSPGSIAGNLYKDANANGVRDTGDSNFSGVTVYLDTNKNGKLDTGEVKTTTDSSGNYKFSNLTAGSTYRVRELTPSGNRIVSPSAGYYDVAITSGSNVTGKNFADTTKVLFSGKVFNDTNGDGSAGSGEAGLSNWKLYLDANNNGKLDSGEVTTLSDSSGNYKFLINAPSSATTYRVREVLNSGWRLTSPSGGVQSVTLSSGGQATGKNFGDTQHVLISGNVFNDANGNKTKDSGEVGLSGFRVFVDANHNGILDSGELTTTTDSSGNWAFKTLNAGTYTIRVTKPSGSTSTYSTTTSLPAAFTLASGASKTGINFGEKKIA